jgi:cytochrome c5
LSWVRAPSATPNIKKPHYLGLFLCFEQARVFIDTIVNHLLKKIVTMRFNPRLLITTVIMFGASSAMANGEVTYKQVCMACHGAGVAGAPKVGDKAKWAPLIKEGQVHITSDGYSGVRAMPAKGGKPDLSVEQFASAVVYMAISLAHHGRTPTLKHWQSSMKKLKNVRRNQPRNSYFTPSSLMKVNH